MATQPTLISVPFANSGAKNTIPQNTTTLGKASLTNGFPTETSMPIADGGVPPQRADFNGMLYWLSTFAVYQQSGGKFTYNATVEYDPPSIIYHNSDLWWCKRKNGPSTIVKAPGSDTNYWIKLRDYLANPLAAYPVGAYYISSESTSPATLFGGTWVQVRDMFILAAGTKYSAGTTANPRTGGGDTKSLSVANIPSHTHTFTTSETGLHTHTANGTTQTAGAHTHTVSGNASQVNNHTHGVSGNTAETGDHAHTVSGNTAASGQHNHSVSGNTANVDAHTHGVSGNTADSTSHTHSVGGSSSSTGSAGTHTHGVSGTTATNGEHSHTRGTMNITGSFSGVGQKYNPNRPDNPNYTATLTGAFYRINTANQPDEGVKIDNNTNAQRDDYFGFDASKSWTGATSTISAHTHTFSTTSASSGSHSHNINLTSGAGGVHKHSISLTSAANGKHLHSISLTTANSVTHTHSISFNSGTTGNHKHSISITSTGAGQHTHTITGTAASNGSHVHSVAITLTDNGKHKHTGTTNATGSGTAFDIMPPYIVAYVWRRTA